MYIDLNCDIGEEDRDGPVLTETEDALLSTVTSVNIACGFHAGDHNAMAALTQAAALRKVAIGAHPGLPDRAGFGRRELDLAPAEVTRLVLYQLGALAAFALAVGSKVTHVKPHGALYHMAEQEDEIAGAIVSAVRDAMPDAFVVGISGGRLVDRARHLGLRAANEVFADRAYRPDGSLVPRDRPDAMIVDPQVAAERIVGLLKTGTIEAVDGTPISLAVDTVCVHGDSLGAVKFATALSTTLVDAGMTLRSLGQ